MQRVNPINSLQVLMLSTAVFAFQSDAAPQTPEKPSRPPHFKQFDKDGNGEISLTEFSQHQPPRGTAEEVFKRIDVNNDGVISKQELAEHRPPRNKDDANNAPCHHQRR